MSTAGKKHIRCLWTPRGELASVLRRQSLGWSYGIGGPAGRPNSDRAQSPDVDYVPERHGLYSARGITLRYLLLLHGCMVRIAQVCGSVRGVRARQCGSWPVKHKHLRSVHANARKGAATLLCLHRQHVRRRRAQES